MGLQSVSLRSRRFAIQLQAIINEFCNIIPWLHGINDLRFATNGTHIEHEICRRLGMEKGAITPYQYMQSREFIGGILAFARSPERLIDNRNLEFVRTLESNRAWYISCLQIQPQHRGNGYGTIVIHQTLRAIRRDHGATVWGVVSDRRLLPWYQSLGASILSPNENRDGLWIVSWTTHNATP